MGFPANSPAGIIQDRQRTWDAPAALRLWHLASLDAPTVALVWSMAFARAGGVHLPGWAPLALALVVWAIYIGDRLLDARAGMQSPPRHCLRERHLFHWRNRWVLGPLGLAAALGASSLVITRLPAGARAPDSALAAVTLAYFSGIHARGRGWSLLQRVLAPLSSRAFLIGVIFTAGCLLPVAAQIPAGALGPTAHLPMLPAVFFAALGWLNCHAIGKWESDRTAPVTGVRSRAWWVAGGGAVLSLMLAWAEPRAAWLAISGAGSGALFVLLDRLSGRLTPVALRASADLVLLTPAFTLCLGR